MQEPVVPQSSRNQCPYTATHIRCRGLALLVCCAGTLILCCSWCLGDTVGVVRLVAAQVPLKTVSCPQWVEIGLSREDSGYVQERRRDEEAE